MRIAKRFVDEMIQHAKDDAPFEACGFLAGKNSTAAKRYPLTNIKRSPVLYEADPNEHFRAQNDMEAEGIELIAIYHSHTRSAAYPSTTDVERAMYPEAVYLIVSLRDPSNPDVRGFRIIDQKDVSEVKLEIT
ncbi:MAG TPA: M67 family metallopeptidase [Actinomycetota bacterium]|jgi:proteasome lid subunit RPN8/RPN11|nr:M67 family metallopeptidase [Actinomycetota bacterium]